MLSSRNVLGRRLLWVTWLSVYLVLIYFVSVGLVFFGKEAQSLALVIYLAFPLTKNLNFELMSKISW